MLEWNDQRCTICGYWSERYVIVHRSKTQLYCVACYQVIDERMNRKWERQSRYNENT